MTYSEILAKLIIAQAALCLCGAGERVENEQQPGKFSCWQWFNFGEIRGFALSALSFIRGTSIDELKESVVIVPTAGRGNLRIKL